jgi:Intracellular proteinase inhibitor
MVERALVAAIVGVAIVFVLATSPAGAGRVTTNERCVAGSLGVTPVPPRRGRAVELDVGPTVGLASGRPVEWQFTVTNRGTRPAALLFLSGMFGDVRLHAAGRQAALDMFFRDGPVYRWSAGRGFVQPLIPAVLPAHSAWRCSLAPGTLDVAPGRHLLVAYVNAALEGRLGPIQFRRYVDVAPAP